MAQPRLKTFPQIRRSLRFYQIASVITGVGLLLLVAEMVLKYTPIGVELWAGGGGFLHFDKVIPGPGCTPTSMLTPWVGGCEIESTGQGFNVSQAILIIHGWFYVVYLLACFRVWSLMRWPFWRFILLAGGGVIPFLSFIMEIFVVRDVRAYLASREDRAAAKRAASESPSPNDPLQEAAQ